VPLIFEDKRQIHGVCYRERAVLPRPMMPFVGRDAELTRLAEMLIAPATPLITLVGEGGMGKTALAIEAARRLLDARIHRDGVFLISLAAVAEVAAIPVAIAVAIGYRFQREGGDERTQLLAHLKCQSLLLLLDNFEHLLIEDDLTSANDLI
jgi:AAA ATPase domain